MKYQGMRIDGFVMDKKMNLYMAGRGQPLILLHSLLSDSESFDRIMPALAARYRVIVPDLPGFGGSPASSGGFDETADRIASLIEAFAPDGEAVLLGNGFGAFVALQTAIRHPALISRLVLMGCGARFSDEGREAFRKMAAAASAGGLAAIAETAMNRLFAVEFQESHPDLMQDRRQAFLRTNVGVFCEACDTLASLDLSAGVSAVRCPTLVIVGDEDQATPSEMAYDLVGRLRDARLSILKGCAHVPPLQAPDEVIALLDQFLAAPVSAHAKTISLER